MLKIVHTVKDSGLVRTAMASLTEVLRAVPLEWAIHTGFGHTALKPELLQLASRNIYAY